MRRTIGGLFLCPLALFLGREAAAQTGSLMFRGDPAHTGVSTDPFFQGQGGVRWRVHTGDAVRSSPAVTRTRVFAGSGDGYLYAIDRATGKVVWRYAAGGPVHASPALAGGLVVAETMAGRIFAVDQASGRRRWSVETGPALPFNTFPAGDWDYLASSPVVVGQTVVIGAPDGGVYALDLATGKQRWRARTNGRVRATPAVADGLVVVGSFDGRVYALDLKTGVERWVHRTEGDTLDSKKWGFDRRAIQGSAAIADGRVYVGSRDSGLYSLDLATGRRRWRFSHRGSWVLAAPSVQGGKIFVGSSDGHFFQAVDSSGKEIWRLPTDANMLGSPLLVGNTIVAGTYPRDTPNGELLAMDPATGKVRWRLNLDASTLSSPVAFDHELYLGTEDGSIVAIGQIGPTIPRLAVFYDSALGRDAFAKGGALAFAYFRDLGYQPLGADSLAAFLKARVTDSVPSAVVFATDVLPRSVAGTPSDTTLFRRYLEAGGKVVWIGGPVDVFVHDSTGQLVGYEIKRMADLIGVSVDSLDFNEYTAKPTVAGRRWGIDRALRGATPMARSAVTEALAVDETGMTTAWVRRYRADRPWSGFVQLWGLGASWDRLPLIRAAAEYGLMR
jgi:eukaryotic-like serine/threonine-protein kinase